MKWPDLAPKSRRSAAEALTTITPVLTGRRHTAPDPALRRALFGYAFNAASASRPVPAEITRALDWIAKASLPAAARPHVGTEWTDNGASRQERGLKHRPPGETRSIPIPPPLVAMLRAHITRYGTAPDGRLFRTARGG
jgi:hypothetical protein